jgi:penicillin amidase
MERLIRMSIDSLTAKQGPDRSQWRWGRINRSELPHALVREFDVPAVERHGGSGFVAAVGATYREIIDINDPDASLATNVPGQSGQPFSPFYQNLVDSYGRGEYFRLLYTRGAVEKAAAHRLVLVPASR